MGLPKGIVLVGEEAPAQQASAPVKRQQSLPKGIVLLDEIPAEAYPESRGMTPVGEVPKVQGFIESIPGENWWEKTKDVAGALKQFSTPESTMFSRAIDVVLKGRSGAKPPHEIKRQMIDLKRLGTDPEYAKQAGDFARHQQENFLQVISDMPATAAEGVLRWASGYTGIKKFEKYADEHGLVGNVDKTLMKVGAVLHRYVTTAGIASKAAGMVSGPALEFGKGVIGLSARNAARFARLMTGYVGGATFWGVDEAGRQIAPYIDQEKELTWNNFYKSGAEVGEKAQTGGTIGVAVGLPVKKIAVPAAGAFRYAYETEQEKKTGRSNKGTKWFKVLLNMFNAATSPTIPEMPETVGKEFSTKHMHSMLQEYFKMREVFDPANPNPRVFEKMAGLIENISKVDPEVGKFLWQQNLPKDVMEKVASFLPDGYHAAPVVQKKAFIKEVSEQLELKPISKAIPDAARKAGLDKIDVRTPESKKNIEESISGLKNLHKEEFLGSEETPRMEGALEARTQAEAPQRAPVPEPVAPKPLQIEAPQQAVPPQEAAPRMDLGGSKVIRTDKRYVHLDKPVPANKKTIRTIMDQIARGKPGKRYWKGDQYMREPSTYPDYFKDKGFERKPAMAALSKMLKGDIKYSVGSKGKDQFSYLKHFNEVATEIEGGVYDEYGRRIKGEGTQAFEKVGSQPQAEKIPQKEINYMEGLKKAPVRVGDLKPGEPVWVNKEWRTVQPGDKDPFGSRKFIDGDTFTKDVDEKISIPEEQTITIKRNILSEESGFLEVPTKEEMKIGLKWLKNTVVPLVGSTPGQRDVLFSKIGGYKLARDRFNENGKKIEKLLDKLGDEFNLNFADKFETGDVGSMNSVELELYDRYKTVNKFLYDTIIKHKDISKLDGWLAHAYESVNPGQKMPAEWKKNPLEGLKTFLHQREIPTIRKAYELWEAGEIENKPVLNVETATKIIYDRVMKYHYMNDMFDMFKDAGDVLYVGGRSRGVPAGFSKIDDQITDVYLKAKLPKGNEVWAKVGEWYAQEDLARLINNHLSVNRIKSNVFGKTLADINHSINMVQLGLSGYHFTATNLHSAGNSLGMAAQDVIRKKPGQAVKHAFLGATGLSGPVRAAKGIKQLRGMLSSEDPEVIKMMEQLYKAGADINGRDAQSTLAQVMSEWKTGGKFQKAGAAAKFVPALIQETVRPLFKYYIPGLKVSASMETYARYKDLYHEDIKLGKVTEATLMRKAYQEAEFNYGKMSKDNVFWNKTLQSVSDFLIRSTMWNATELVHLGGGEAQTMKQLLNFVEGRPTEFTNNMADLWGIATAHILLGSIIYYGRHGEAPKNLKDAVVPPTKEVNDEGFPIRTSIPGYPKDMVNWHMHPIKSVRNKLAPLYNGLNNLKNNENFFGDYIYNPDGDQKVQQAIGYLLSEWTLPFSVKDVYRRYERGDKILSPTTAANFFGFREASREWTVPSLEKKIYKLYRKQTGMDYRTTPEHREYRKKYVNARRGIFTGKFQKSMEELIKYSKRTGIPLDVLRSSKKMIKEKFEPGALRAFKKLNQKNQFKALKGASEEAVMPYLREIWSD